MKIARSFNCGFDEAKTRKPRRGDRIFRNGFVSRPSGALLVWLAFTRSFNCGLCSVVPEGRSCRRGPMVE